MFQDKRLERLNNIDKESTPLNGKWFLKYTKGKSYSFGWIGLLDEFTQTWNLINFNRNLQWKKNIYLMNNTIRILSIT